MFRVECFKDGKWKPMIDPEENLLVYYPVKALADAMVTKLKLLLAINQMPAHQFRVVQF